MFDKAILGKTVFIDGLKDVGIFIKNGKIKKICPQSHITQEELNKARQSFVFDENYVIFPSAIDSQVHSRSQKHAEGFSIASNQAVSGGVATLVEMPYDDGLLICNKKNFLQKKDEGLEESKADFALYATIDPKDGTKHIDELIENGCCGFKFSLFETDATRFPRIAPYLLYESFQKIAPSGLVCGVHNEDNESIQYLIARTKKQHNDYTSHNLSRPIWTENIAIVQVYELGVHTGANTHIVHASNQRAYEIARTYRDLGYKASIECCLHYLIFCEEDDVQTLKGIAKVNPPIRNKAQRELLWEELKNDTITCISTDHVNWALDKKNKENMFDNASGMTGLEILVPLLLTEAQKRGVRLSQIAKLLAYNPARLFNIAHQKGAIEIEKDADIVILKKESYQYHHSIAQLDYSAYYGRELDFRVVKHFIRGELVFDEGNLLKHDGFGEFIAARGLHNG